MIRNKLFFSKFDRIKIIDTDFYPDLLTGAYGIIYDVWNNTKKQILYDIYLDNPIQIDYDCTIIYSVSLQKEEMAYAQK